MVFTTKRCSCEVKQTHHSHLVQGLIWYIIIIVEGVALSERTLIRSILIHGMCLFR